MTGRVWFLSLGLLSTAYLCFVMRQELIWTITTVGHVFGRPSSATHFRPLKFGRDGTFEITVFNDLHFGEGEDNRSCLPPCHFVLYLILTFPVQLLSGDGVPYQTKKPYR